MTEDTRMRTSERWSAIRRSHAYHKDTVGTVVDTPAEVIAVVALLLTGRHAVEVVPYCNFTHLWVSKGSEDALLTALESL